MTDLRKLSSLPDDPGYWEDLEARFMADLGPRVRAKSERGPAPWTPRPAHAWGLGGLAAAAAVAAVLFVPARTSDAEAAAPNPAGLLRLPNDDPTLHAFIAAPEPPPVAALVLPRTVRDSND